MFVTALRSAVEFTKRKMDRHAFKNQFHGKRSSAKNNVRISNHTHSNLDILKKLELSIPFKFTYAPTSGEGLRVVTVTPRSDLILIPTKFKNLTKLVLIEQ